MVDNKNLVFRKKASGNFIVNIANVLNKFVNENDEVQVEERLAADKAKRIVAIKAAVKEEEAAAELAERNRIIAEMLAIQRDEAVKTAEKAQAEIAAFNQLPPELQALMQIKI